MKSWIDRTSFGDSVSKMSYKKLIDVYGELRGAEVAKHFGIKPLKKTTKKEKEDKGED